jgi:hypothetical protein
MLEVSQRILFTIESKNEVHQSLIIQIAVHNVFFLLIVMADDICHHSLTVLHKRQSFIFSWIAQSMPLFLCIFFRVSHWRPLGHPGHVNPRWPMFGLGGDHQMYSFLKGHVRYTKREFFH